MVAVAEVQTKRRLTLSLLGRLLPGLGAALTAYELYQWLNEQDGSPIARASRGWTLVSTCAKPNNATGISFLMDMKQAISGNAGCGYGQNTSPPALCCMPIGAPVANTVPSLVWRALYKIQPSNPNIQTIYWSGQHSYWTRPTPHNGVAPGYVDLRWTMPDPNLPLPVVPQPPPAPGETPDEHPDTITEGWTDPITQEFGPEPGPPRVTTTPRRWPEPPPRGTKERKVRSIGTTIFKILDSISETAEVIGAFYDALPKDVRKRWDRKGRGLIDQAGQYGIDGADWKIQALWNNWDRVDMQQALVNLAKNEIEDKFIGEIMRRLPKQVGSAITDPAFKAYGKLSGYVMNGR